MADFTINLKWLADLAPAERQRVDEIDRIGFAGEVDDLEWSTSQWILLGYAGQLQVAQVGILVREVLVGDNPIRVGGIGGVATHPDWRKNGYAQRLMVEAARVMRDPLGLEFGVLACAAAMLPYYSRLGWQAVHAPVWVVSHGVRRLLPDYTMTLQLGERSWPEGTIDLCGAPW